MNTYIGQEPRPLDAVAARKPIPWELSGTDRFPPPPRDVASPIPTVAEPGLRNTTAAFVDQAASPLESDRSPKQTPSPGLGSSLAPHNNGSPTIGHGRTTEGNGPAMTQGPGFTPPGAAASTPPPPSTDQFTIIQQRLRDWGATYYRLETWGNSGQMYRFYCKMAIARSPSHTQYFEATGNEPLQAMGKVLHDVETWRMRH